MTEEEDRHRAPEKGLKYGHPSLSSFRGYDGPDKDQVTDAKPAAENDTDGVKFQHKLEDDEPTATAATTFSTDADTSETRAAKILEIVTRQDTFDGYIAFPSPKKGSGSPEIDTNKTNYVTPDQVFGPTSPRKSHSYTSNYVPNRTNHKTESSYNTDKMASNRRGVGNSRARRKSSFSEKPLRSHSRFEYGNGVDFDDVDLKNEENSRHEKEFKGKSNEDSPGGNDTNEVKNGTSSRGGSNGDKAESRRPSLNGFSHSRRPSNGDEVTSNGVSPPSTLNATRNGHNSRNTRLDHQINPRDVSPSRAPSYDHSHIVDDSLHISDSKLDSTLLKMYSQSRAPNRKGSYMNSSDSNSSPLSYSQSDVMGMEPVMWRVHPMSATHKETLDRDLDFLAFHVKPKEVIGRLYKDGILTSMDYNQIARIDGQGDRAMTRLLIKTLQRRGSRAYPAFIDALLAIGQSFVCEHLTDSGRSLKHGMAADRATDAWRPDMGNISGVTNGFDISSPYKTESPPYVSDFAGPSYQNLLPANHHLPSRFGHFNGLSPTNRMTPLNHMSPVVTMMSPPTVFASYPVQPMNSDLWVEARLDQLGAGLHTLHDDIMALRSGRPFSPWPGMRQAGSTYHGTPHHFPTIGSNPRGTVTTADGRVIDANYLEQQLEVLQRKLAELAEYVAALRAARMNPPANPRDTSNMVQPNHYGPGRGSLNPDQQNAAPGSQAAFPPHLEHQFGDLRSKVKELHDDIAAMRTARQNANENADTSTNHQRRGVDPSKLDHHLRDLRREIHLLHDDVTALKNARSSRASTDPRMSRSLPRHLPSDTRRDSYDDNYLSPTRRSRTTDFSRNRNDGYNTSDGPIELTYDQLYTRYPSRYSPREDYKREPEDRRATSRANSRAASRADSRANSRAESRANSRAEQRADSRADNRSNNKRNGRPNDNYYDDKYDNRPDRDKRLNGNTKSRDREDEKLQPNRSEKSHAARDDSNKENNDPTRENKTNRDRPWHERREPDEAGQKPIPVIVTDDDDAQRSNTPPRGRRRRDRSDEPSRENDHLTAHDPASDSRPKKKVSYKDEPDKDDDRQRRSSSDRPMTRARERDRSPGRPGDEGDHPHRSNGRSPTSSPRPGSRDGSTLSNGDYRRVTNPTRVLSPPHGPDVRRVTSPLHILQDPNDRKITTWSEDTAKSAK